MRRNDSLKFVKKRSQKSWDIWIWPNWWPVVTRIEVLPSYNPIPGFQEGTVRHTLVTKTEKKGHQISHFFPRHFNPYIYICIYGRWKEKHCPHQLEIIGRSLWDLTKLCTSALLNKLYKNDSPIRWDKVNLLKLEIIFKQTEEDTTRKKLVSPC